MNTKARITSGRPGRSRQEGIVLLVALVFLVLLTIIGLSLFGTTTLEEKMSRNYRDYNQAFQAAEAALRDAEIRVSGYWVYASNSAGTPKPVDPLAFSSTCTNGLCSQAATQPIYSSYSFTNSPSVALGTCPGGCDGRGNGTGTASPTLPTSMFSQQPRYLIESIPWAPPGESLTTPSGSNRAYRTTAVGYGRNATTQVMVQEIFIPY